MTDTGEGMGVSQNQPGCAASPATSGAEPSALASLLARVEGATGPDREADCFLWALGLGIEPEWQGTSPVVGEEGVIGWIDPGVHARNFGCNRSATGPGSIPAYTASLDAALALVERALPGWNCSAINLAPDPAEAYVWKRSERFVRDFDGKGATPALALLAALLRALADAPSGVTASEERD